jgi:electron transfer flavoprotein alpha subunit
MKLVVLVKHVPVVSALRFDPETRRLERQGVPSEVSSFDVRALVRAVELKAEDDELVVMTMGPPEATASLAHCLALGADRAIHLVDRAFAGSDTLATARVLARALEREGFDLVLCGRNSVDAETGQVGPEVAELLDVVQVTCAHRLDIDRAAKLVRAEREGDDGYETVEVRMPALVTAAEDLAPEKFPTKAAREAAGTKPILAMGAPELDLAPDTVGTAGSPTFVEELQAQAGTREGRLVEGGSLADAVEQLADELARRGLLDEGDPSADRSPAAADAPAAPTGPAVWVVAEALGGALRPVTLELLGKAGELAAARRGHVVGVLMGAGADMRVHAAALGAHGADVVGLAEDDRLEPYTTDAHATVLADAIRTRRPAVVLVPATATGRDLAPRVAARLGLGLTGDCVDLDIAADGGLIQHKPAFGGNVIAPIRSRTLPEMATVRPGMLRGRRANPRRRVVVEPLSTTGIGEPRLRILARSRAEASDAARLDSANVVVGVGKGIGGVEGFARVRSFAADIGAAIAATREVTDLGWLPRQHQVGLTGRAIAPRLYLALAIRGAPEHVVGLRRAGFVVAVNTSPKAPMFKHADRGIVADYAEVLPLLRDALARRR